MNLAQSERAALCDELLRRGPDAPTLCEGWDAHDLACHLWIRENDPLGAPGLVARPLQPVTDRRMLETRRKWSYPELVERLAKGPLSLSVFAIPGVDAVANSVEYFVHHEDLRRADPDTRAPRALAADDEQLLWRRLRLMARVMFRHADMGVVLVAPGIDPTPVTAAKGDPTVTITGRPGELVLYAYGRREVADVAISGDPEAVAALAEVDLRA